MRDSILYSSFRALFVSIFTILGIVFGLILVVVLIGALSGSSSTSEDTAKAHFKKEVLPDANWKRTIHGSDSPVILQINIDGVIGMDGLTTSNIHELLVESRENDLKNDRVKGILLYINTPGGTVIDSNGIYQTLKQYREKFNVPIYAYADGMCASGGMYIAAAADKVFANEVTLVGSVGVLVPPFWNVTQLLDKIGVSTMTLSAGKGKEAMNPLRAWKEGEQDNYQHLVDFYYKMFVDIVANNRPKVNKEKLVQDYGAQVFPAEKALEVGFVDVAGVTRDDVLRALATDLGIEEGTYQVIQLQSRDWWNALFTSQTPFSLFSPLFTGKIKHEINLTSEIPTELQNKYLYLYKTN